MHLSRYLQTISMQRALTFFILNPILQAHKKLHATEDQVLVPYWLSPETNPFHFWFRLMHVNLCFRFSFITSQLGDGSSDHCQFKTIGHIWSFDKFVDYSATTPTKATLTNFLQIVQSRSSIWTIDFPLISNIATTDRSWATMYCANNSGEYFCKCWNVIGQFVKNLSGWLWLE